jgi:redox-sensitive bicupin YhaK (pirin superfamily)
MTTTTKPSQRAQAVEAAQGVLAVVPLRSTPWPTLDPFLFCVHHDDAYPAGDERMAPAASLAGRNLGSDFEGKDGWRMYHGDVVPGFPSHPHRGFETVTIVRRGFIDHSDSLGATARFGEGDVQWLTAGKGIVHCEMFPLREREQPNPLELFQIWLNLHSTDKMADPHFTMLWKPAIPVRRVVDEAGRTTTIVAIAGDLGGAPPPSPPPRSWAARTDSKVAIATITLEPGARFTVPAVDDAAIGRVLYFFTGKTLTVDGKSVAVKHAIQIGPGAITLVAGDEACDLLLLQGRPIGEPVAQHGPFVMNAPDEIRQAYADYQRTRFGGWPWPSDAPVHERERGRFAIHADGRHEDAPSE